MISRRLLSGFFQTQRIIVGPQLISVRHHNFDGETYSKTNLVLMTKEDDTHTYVEAFSPLGFRLSSGFRILGPCAIFPKSVLHWNVASAEKISPASLSLFCMLEPKLDLLILGIGDRGATYDKNIIKYLKSKRINVEILPTEQACSTFNFLNSERRVVAAALIPPKEMESAEEDLIIADLEEQMHLHEDHEGLPDSPEVTKTMKSFHERGVLDTLRDFNKDTKHAGKVDADEQPEGKQR